MQLDTTTTQSHARPKMTVKDYLWWEGVETLKELIEETAWEA